MSEKRDKPPASALPAEPALKALPAPEPPPEPAPEPEPSVRPRRIVYVAAVLVLAAVTALGYLAGSTVRRNEPRELLADAFERVHDADTEVRHVDDAVRAGLAARPEAIRAAEEGVPAGRERLLSALDALSRAQRGLKGRDLERAHALRKAAEGRLAMLRAASLLLPLQSRAATAFGAAEDGWASVRRAGELADRAAEAFNTHTASGVESSTVLTEQAESELASAYAVLLAARRVMPEADLKATLDYVARKRESAAASRRVDAVWLRGGADEANSMLAQLAAKEPPLDALLQRLPRSSGATVRTAYEELSLDLADDYAIGQRLAREGDEALAAVSAPQPSE